MITQPSSAASATGATGASAAGAAILVGAGGDGIEDTGAELQGTPGATNPVPFSQALLALVAGTDPAGALLAATGVEPAAAGTTGAAGAVGVAGVAGVAGAAGAAAAPLVATDSCAFTTTRGSNETVAPVATTPANGADPLPSDLLLALFAAPAAVAEAGDGQRKTGLAGGDDARAFAAATELQAGTAKTDQTAATPAAPADPGAALLAAVLQWLQQQHAGAREASTTATIGGNGRDSSADATSTIDTTAMAAAKTAPIANSSAALAGTVRAAGTGAGIADAMPAAAPGATLASDGRAASGDQPRAPALTPDSAGNAAGLAGTGAGTVMDMAAALRAASAASPAPIERSVAVPVHERHWPTALAAQVLVLSNDKVQAATLRLSPEHLGPVEVRIDMQESNVNVSFTAAHSETRAALEQAMPQLRAVLAGAGLSLGQATVQQQARRESHNSNTLPRAGGTADESIEAPAAMARALGMIDEYV